MSSSSITNRRLPHRATYTQQQLREVYDRFDVPSKYRYEPGDFSREVVKRNNGLGYLTALIRHALASVPFENLSLHYSVHHDVSIDAHLLYDKIVRHGRGGTSLENNIFFNTVLRSCGFDVYSVAARVNTRIDPAAFTQTSGDPTFSGFSHCVNLVTLHDDVFLVDVGLGPGSPIQPIQLKTAAVQSNIQLGQATRLQYGPVPGLGTDGRKLWTLERGDADEKQWVPLYTFSTEVEFFPQDFEIMNFYASVHRKSSLLHRLICWQAVLSEDRESVVGDALLLDDKVIQKREGRPEKRRTLKSEAERLQALKDVFGLRLEESEQRGIEGLVTALPFVADDPKT